MRGSFAAVTLAVTIIFAAVGTILQVDLPAEPEAVASAPRSADLPLDLLRIAERTGRGLERLAGRPAAD